jgi:hypothetical protein
MARCGICGQIFVAGMCMHAVAGGQPRNLSPVPRFTRREPNYVDPDSDPTPRAACRSEVYETAMTQVGTTTTTTTSTTAEPTEGQRPLGTSLYVSHSGESVLRSGEDGSEAALIGRVFGDECAGAPLEDCIRAKPAEWEAELDRQWDEFFQSILNQR